MKWGNLEMMGLYVEDKPNGRKETHMIGRTRNLPHKYFYRKCMEYPGESSIEWTPWEKVDLDIEADHVVPIIFNRNLFLFWPTFRVKNDDDQKNDDYKETGKSYQKQKENLHYLETTLNKAEYFNNKWINRKVGKEPVNIYAESSPKLPELKHFTFHLAGNANLIFVGPNLNINPLPIQAESTTTPAPVTIFESFRSSKVSDRKETVVASFAFIDQETGAGIPNISCNINVNWDNWKFDFDLQGNPTYTTNRFH
ncbi:MAG: hypothetical protein IPJ00_09205 [Saprospirales bacterium]|nr:hypothetical protein [Saprospirales bacterium]